MSYPVRKAEAEPLLFANVFCAEPFCNGVIVSFLSEFYCVDQLDVTRVYLLPFEKNAKDEWVRSANHNQLVPEDEPLPLERWAIKQVRFGFKEPAHWYRLDPWVTIERDDDFKPIGTKIDLVGQGVRCQIAR